MTFLGYFLWLQSHAEPTLCKKNHFKALTSKGYASLALIATQIGNSKIYSLTMQLHHVQISANSNTICVLFTIWTLFRTTTICDLNWSCWLNKESDGRLWQTKNTNITWTDVSVRKSRIIAWELNNEREHLSWTFLGRFRRKNDFCRLQKRTSRFLFTLFTEWPSNACTWVPTVFLQFTGRDIHLQKSSGPYTGKPTLESHRPKSSNAITQSTSLAIGVLWLVMLKKGINHETQGLFVFRSCGKLLFSDTLKTVDDSHTAWR